MPAAPRLPVDLQGGFGPGGSGISVEPPNITWPGMPPPGYMGGGELGYSGLGYPSSIDITPGGGSFVPPTYYYNRVTGPGGIDFDTNPVPGWGPPLPGIPGAFQQTPGAAGAPPPIGRGRLLYPGGFPGAGSGFQTSQVPLTPGAPFSAGGTGSGFGGVGPTFGGGGSYYGQPGGYGSGTGGGYGYGSPAGGPGGGKAYPAGFYAGEAGGGLGMSILGGSMGFLPVGFGGGGGTRIVAVAQRGGRVPWTGPAFLHEGERVIPKGGTMKDANKPVKDFGWFPTPPSWGGFGSPGAGTSGGLLTGGVPGVVPGIGSRLPSWLMGGFGGFRQALDPYLALLRGGGGWGGGQMLRPFDPFLGGGVGW